MSMTLKATKNMCLGLSVVYKITSRRSFHDRCPEKIGPLPEKIGPLVHPDMSGKYGTGLNLLKLMAGKNIPGIQFLAYAQPPIFCIWQEAHVLHSQGFHKCYWHKQIENATKVNCIFYGTHIYQLHFSWGRIHTSMMPMWNWSSCCEKTVNWKVYEKLGNRWAEHIHSQKVSSVKND